MVAGRSALRPRQTAGGPSGGVIVGASWLAPRTAVSGRITIGLSSPLAPWTVITRISPSPSPAAPGWRRISASSSASQTRNPVSDGGSAAS